MMNLLYPIPPRLGLFLLADSILNSEETASKIIFFNDHANHRFKDHFPAIT